jgi:dihydrofolate synthase/folylpolyglutamate synthase
LKTAGINAGLFTSPHLVHFGERIRDAEGMISPEEIESGIARLRDLVRDWDPHPTFFELAFALALDWFAQRGLEWIVLETGLGGRLDATNAITPVVSVITPIGWDHMQILGDTLAKIASEKAGIIKPGVPFVTQTQDLEALDVLLTTAREKAAPLTLITEPCEFPLGLAGPHQRWNAALALAALHAAGLDLPPSVLEAGLKQVEWPARFQRLRADVILDGAHNLDAARVLAQTWREQFPHQKATIVFGAVAGKDITAVLHELAPLATEWHFTHFDSPRAMPAEDLQTILGTSDVPVFCHPNLTAALEASRNDSPRLITGSLYLAGEVLAAFQSERGSYQRSWQ